MAATSYRRRLNGPVYGITRGWSRRSLSLARLSHRSVSQTKTKTSHGMKARAERSTWA